MMWMQELSGHEDRLPSGASEKLWGLIPWKKPVACT